MSARRSCSSSCDRRAAAALRVRDSCTDFLSHSLRAFSRVFSCVLISSVCGDLTAVVCYESVWAAELELRRPYVIAHRALPFASAAQQQAPAPRGPILSELASVNGRGGGVLLEQGAPKLQNAKTEDASPARRGPRRELTHSVHCENRNVAGSFPWVPAIFAVSAPFIQKITKAG